jgi:hypothetical protein
MHAVNFAEHTLEDLFEINRRYVPSNGQHVVVVDKLESTGLP